MKRRGFLASLFALPAAQVLAEVKPVRRLPDYGWAFACTAYSLSYPTQESTIQLTERMK